ncbi:MAG: alpha/beta hydrolase [Gemmatimonadales bacterium]|nr:MAG: alpha/beta hydrolase [Gemmatimonadales bacterium]
MTGPAGSVEFLDVAAFDGTRLTLRRWHGAVVGAGRGTVLIVHGVGEHGGRYDEVAARLGTTGWRVFCHDQRGHGLSDGSRGRLRRDDDLLEDLTVVVDHVRSLAPGPLLLLGHSLGGVVAGRFVAEARRPVDLLVLSSPALDPGLSPAKKILVRWARQLLPDITLGNGLDPRGISRDPEVVAAYRADPLVHDRISPRLAAFLVESGPRVIRAAPAWRVPTLVMWAGDDSFVGPNGSAEFVRTAPAGTVTGRCFPEHRHEILNDVDRELVFAELEAWLRLHGQEPGSRFVPQRGGPPPPS